MFSTPKIMERSESFFLSKSSPKERKSKRQSVTREIVMNAYTKNEGKNESQMDEYFEIIKLENRKGQTNPKSRAQLRVRKITANTI